MCASKDDGCIKDTYSYILSRARTQDIIYFMNGLKMNYLTRRSCAQFFKDNYAEVRYLLEPERSNIKRWLFRSLPNGSKGTSHSRILSLYVIKLLFCCWKGRLNGDQSAFRSLTKEDDYEQIVDFFKVNMRPAVGNEG